MTTQAFDLADDSTLDTVFALRRTTSRRLAHDCLEAGRAFMDESKYWGKAELAMWLLGPYSQVAQDVASMPPSSRPQLRQLDVSTISNLIDNARAEVEYTLARLYNPESSSEVVFSMLAAGFTAPTVDANGVTGWAPTTTAHRLADRVASLFVAAFMSQVFQDETTEVFALAA